MYVQLYVWINSRIFNINYLIKEKSYDWHKHNTSCEWKKHRKGKKTTKYANATFSHMVRHEWDGCYLGFKIHKPHFPPYVYTCMRWRQSWIWDTHKCHIPHFHHMVIHIHVCDSDYLSWIHINFINSEVLYIYTPTKVKHHPIFLSIYFFTSILLKQ